MLSGGAPLLGFGRDRLAQEGRRVLDLALDVAAQRVARAQQPRLDRVGRDAEDLRRLLTVSYSSM